MLPRSLRCELAKGASSPVGMTVCEVLRSKRDFIEERTRGGAESSLRNSARNDGVPADEVVARRRPGRAQPGMAVLRGGIGWAGVGISIWWTSWEIRCDPWW